MPLTNLNVGAAPNDGTGDTLRSGGQKINTNYTFTVTTDTAQTITGAKSFSADVGIGTTSPLAQQHISGAGQTTANLTDAGNRGGMLRLSDTGSASGNGGAIVFGASQSDTANSLGFAAIKGFLTEGGNNTAGDLAFATRNGSADTNLTEKLRITNDGNVGIGTTSPGTKLHVVGPGGFGDGAGTSTSFIATTGTGNTAATLGIGTGSGNSFDISLFAAGTGTPNAAVLNNRNNAPMLFFTNNTERMRITSAGDVAITQAAGRYTIDTTGGATTVANNGTVNFANASGMLVVNNHDTGHVTIYLCGGGFTTVVASVGGQVGTLAFNSGISGYTWTNNSGSSATFGFFFVRTRTTA